MILTYVSWIALKKRHATRLRAWLDERPFEERKARRLALQDDVPTSIRQEFVRQRQLPLLPTQRPERRRRSDEERAELKARRQNLQDDVPLSIKREMAERRRRELELAEKSREVINSKGDERKKTVRGRTRRTNENTTWIAEENTTTPELFFWSATIITPA